MLVTMYATNQKLTVKWRGEIASTGRFRTARRTDRDGGARIGCPLYSSGTLYLLRRRL